MPSYVNEDGTPKNITKPHLLLFDALAEGKTFLLVADRSHAESAVFNDMGWRLVRAELIKIGAKGMRLTYKSDTMRLACSRIEKMKDKLLFANIMHADMRAHQHNEILRYLFEPGFTPERMDCASSAMQAARLIAKISCEPHKAC